MNADNSNDGRRPPKHVEISNTLREEVLGGLYGAEGRLPSEARLVERFNASRPTIARALRTLQDEDLVDRRAGSGTFVIPLDQRASSPQNRPRTLAMLIPDLRNTEIFQRIAGEIASLSRVKGYGILWGSSGEPKLETDTSLEHGEELAAQFIERNVDGVFFAPYELIKGKSQANQRMAQRLRDAGIPLILIDRDYLPYPQRSDFDTVGVDNVSGGYTLGEHLIKLGAKNICFVHPPHSAPSVSARITGLRSAVDAHHLPWNANRIFEGDASNPVFVRKIIAKGKPDAIVASNDHTAALLLQALTKLSYAVPSEIKVVGFDDVNFATLVNPPLTTLRQPSQEIARAAYRAMLERLKDPTIPPRQISLPGNLVVRSSCGAYQ